MTDTAMTEKQEEQMVHLVRNALLVAGQEMGDGDQWPVIKSTIYDLMRGWEDTKANRNVCREVKKHCASVIAELESMHDECEPELRKEMDKTIAELRELYDAAFSEVDIQNMSVNEDSLPIYMKRAKHIIQTMEDDNE
ncbi:MAG: hypothetical protein KGI97_00910 [Alphaproteobacteria bacterium]|nr:hypothetical protein [Alphaproteobacteria bacterium]